MVNTDLEQIVGESLRGLCAEIFARKGYHVTETPENYEGVDVLAATPVSTEQKVCFMTVTGRASVEYLSRGDMKEAIPKNLNMPVEGVLLIITTTRRSSSSARQVAKEDGKNKDVWYASDLLNELALLESEYLIKLYSEGLNGFTTKEELTRRFDYQDINVGSDVISYICERTYHPRRLIALIELRSRGYSPKLNETEAVRKFKKETGVLSYLR